MDRETCGRMLCGFIFLQGKRPGSLQQIRWMTMRSKFFPCFGFSIFALTACSSAGDVFHQANRSITSDLTLLGASAQPIVRGPEGSLCFGPQPDATIDEDVAAGGGSVGFGAGDNELPLGGRNPNVLITRDIFFQSCLAETRLKLSPKERKALYYKTLETVQAINSASLEGAYVTSDADSGSQTIVTPNVPAEGRSGQGSSGF